MNNPTTTLYILKCRDGTLYTGITNNLERRLREHNGKISGGAKYTHGRRPVKLVYSKKFVTRKEASIREYEIKHTLTREEKKKLIGKK